MKQKDSSSSVGALFIGLGVVVIMTIAVISTLGMPLFSGASMTFSPEVITPGITGDVTPLTPDAPAVQTDVFMITQKAIIIATDSAITRTPLPTQPVPPTGIYENVRIKFTGELLFLAAQNKWEGFIGGYRVSVYAGALLDDPTQGAIVVYLMLPYRSYFEHILTPGKNGSVRVVAEANNRLTLVAADGTIFYFDVPARQFVTTLTEVIPTATLPPTYTPYVYTPGMPALPGTPYP